MNQKERLVVLLRKDNCCIDYDCNKCLSNIHCYPKTVADLILDDGWMRPPCKVGDVVYAKKGCFYLPHATQIKSDAIITCEVIAIKETKKGKYILLKPLIEETFGMRSANGWFPFSAIDKTVFTSREEALSKLQASCKQVKGGASDA